MNILLVGRNAQIGGGSTFRFNIGRGLLARGHQVGVSALGGPMVARYRAAGLRFHWTPPFAACVALLSGAIRRDRAQIVHASNTTAGDLALLACRKTGVPLVVSLHNTISNEEAQHPCLKAARRILVFDRGAAESASKFTSQFEAEKITRIPRPVEHRPVDPNRISPVHVAYVARLSSRKGKIALALLDAFEEFGRETPEARLTLLGDGSMWGEVSERAQAVSRATGCRIELHRRVLDPHTLLETAGVVVGAGYAALEATMQGRAVIGAGFKGYGLVTEENVLDAIECNFGDTVGRWEMSGGNFLQLLRQLRDAWKAPSLRDSLWGLDRIVAPIHGIPEVAARLEAVYREVLSGE